MFKLPPLLKSYKNLYEVVQEELALIDRTLLLFYFVDATSPETLPYLAKDLNVNSIEWSLADTEEKRKMMLKESFLLHQKKGTVWALERVLEILGLNGNIVEWFDAGKDPYTFAIDLIIGETGLTKLTFDTMRILVNDYKRKVATPEITTRNTIEKTAYIGAAIRTSRVVKIPATDLPHMFSASSSYTTLVNEAIRKTAEHSIDLDYTAPINEATRETAEHQINVDYTTPVNEAARSSHEHLVSISYTVETEEA